MRESVSRYLSKRAASGPWQLEPEPARKYPLAIVIPALAERDTLPKTLASLLGCASHHNRTLVVIVVNNRAPGTQDATAIAENQQTLKWLRETHAEYPFALAIVDASSHGNTLPDKGGVGLARKIGFDLALKHISDRGALVGLDADTTVSANYLAELHEHFANAGAAWGAVVDYAHPTDRENADQIILYESFLRYHALSLRRAGSPYAYHTIGSAMAATADAYVASGGMNTRQAGEDFYFLERLAKTGQVDRIMTARVYPSARRSWRVPFGTGRALAQPESLETVYAPESYDILGRWLSTLETASDMSADWLRTEAAEIEVTLGEFLEFDGFHDDWTRICEQAKSESQYQRRAHDRFGAWTTLKLLHHLRDTRFPDAPIWSAVETLLEHLDAADGFSEPDSRSSATNVLETLRNLDRR